MNQHKARVRVVILTMHDIDLTVQCVRSVRRQDYDALDIVVVDNDAQPERTQVLREALDGVMVVPSSVNLGYARGNNLGSRPLNGVPTPDYVFLLNNDTILIDEHLIRLLVQALEQHPHALAVSPLIDTVSSGLPVREQIQVRRHLPLLATIVANDTLLRRTPIGRKLFKRFTYADLRPIEPRIYEVDTINGAAFLVRHSFLQDIGYLDASTFLYYEELIFGRQVERAGGTCLLDGRVCVQHLQGATSRLTRRQIRWSIFRYSIDSETYYYRAYLQARPWAVLGVRALRLVNFAARTFVYWAQAQLSIRRSSS